ncbi:MAG: protein BatD [Bacteroidaceae bacterium]|nr:protein BatD [Bacteroidaceae bacterium]
MRKIILSTFLILTTICTAFADEVSFIASAPKSVVAGKRFELKYEANKKTDGQPTIPEIDGLRILTGPHSSFFTQSSNVNGRRTSTQTITFTYIVVIDKEGDVTIPGASVMVDGKQVVSNPVTIKALPESQAAAAASSQQQNNNSRGSSTRQSGSSNTDISNENLFIVASVSKTKVYEQEALQLTYKVYTDVNLVNLDNPAPDLKGFNIQEVELPQQRQFELERYNGRNYNTMVWRKFILFPQESGKLEIPSMEYEAVVAVQTRRTMDPFEMMFNGGYSYVNVNKKVKSNKVIIDVEKLPAGKPQGFSGAVGQFNVSSSVSTSSLKSNEEFTLKVVVKGDGNMKLMGDPVVEFPSEFDVYDPIISNKYKLTNKGFAGEKIYEYVVTPRTAGQFTLPAAKFVYFDTATNNYKVVEGKEFTIDVAKGATTTAQTGNVYIVKEEGKLLANDIRYIKLGADENGNDGKIYESALYWLTYVVSLLAFVVAVLVYRKRMKENENVSLVKTKKANSVAVRRLKNVKTLLRNNQENEFYDETLKAIWYYMSDKLNIPLSQLSKDNISNELSRRGCDDELVAELMNLLNECEFARYAPGDSGATMDKVYKMAVAVISKMENSIRK